MESTGNKIRHENINVHQAEFVMNQYVTLEDRIMTGLEYLFRQPEAAESKQRMFELIEKFNICSADLQEEWSSRQWETYNELHFGTGSELHILDKSEKEIAKQVEEARDLAIILSKIAREKGSVQIEVQNKKFYLSSVDQDAQRFKQKTVIEKQKQCSPCDLM